MSSLLRNPREVPPLTWLASRKIALTLLVSKNNYFHHHSSLTHLPPHLRQDILYFVIRTGAPQTSTDFSINDQDLLSMFCPQLTELDFAGCDKLSRITLDGWAAIKDLSPNITKITVERWQDRSSLVPLISGHTHLLDLNMSRVLGSLTDEMMAELLESSSFPHLTNLNISHNDNITDLTLVALGLVPCAKLSNINLNCCYKITDDGLDSLLNGCHHHIHSLGIKRCAFITDLSLRKHSDQFQYLEHINVKGCNEIDGECWTNILGASLHTGKTWKLAEQNGLSLTHIMDQATNVGPPSSFNYEFTTLDFSWHEELEEAVVCTLVSKSPMLETLKFRACETIGNQLITTVANTCHRLTKINVGRCNSINNASIVLLAHACSGLKDCNFSWSLCEDSGIVALLLECPLLTNVSIQGCKSITSEGIHESVITHTYLRWLDCSWCNGISEKMAVQLIEHRKNKSNTPLEVLDYYGESTKTT